MVGGWHGEGMLAGRQRTASCSRSGGLTQPSSAPHEARDASKDAPMGPSHEGLSASSTWGGEGKLVRAAVQTEASMIAHVFDCSTYRTPPRMCVCLGGGNEHRLAQHRGPLGARVVHAALDCAVPRWVEDLRVGSGWG